MIIRTESSYFIKQKEVKHHGEQVVRRASGLHRTEKVCNRIRDAVRPSSISVPIIRKQTATETTVMFHSELYAKSICGALEFVSSSHIHMP